MSGSKNQHDVDHENVYIDPSPLFSFNPSSPVNKFKVPSPSN